MGLSVRHKYPLSVPHVPRRLVQQLTLAGGTAQGVYVLAGERVGVSARDLRLGAQKSSKDRRWARDRPSDRLVARHESQPRQFRREAAQ
jgi:hypothetical protein